MRYDFIHLCSNKDVTDITCKFSDVQKLLTMYQLWLDELYPRAKFTDGLAMIEKLGHSRQLQFMRRTWIDEGKPKPSDEPEDEGQDHPSMLREKSTLAVATTEQSSELGEAPHAAKNAPDDSGQTATRSTNGLPEVNDEFPEEDELDALLAETSRERLSATRSLFGGGGLAPASKHGAARNEEDMFADEMEAMQEMNELW